ncbi:hypothetical protein R6Q59_009734 [Mikania micrantha]
MRRVHDSRKLPVSGEMPDTVMVSSSRLGLVKEEYMNHLNAPNFQDSKLPVSVRKCKGKKSLQDVDELMPDASILKANDDSYDEIGSTSFSGASHPPEPIDMDLMRPIFGSPACQDSDEKECVWDVSLPPSGNVSPHSSIDSTSVVTSMSTGTGLGLSMYCTSDEMLSVERSFGITKIPLRGESLESGKTSISRANNGSGLSDDSNWSNFTGGTNKPHKSNDPRWKAILAIRPRDGLLGMSNFRLLRLLGSGDIGSVYQLEPSGTRCYFAMKVMDKASLSSRKKLSRAQTERGILQLLDHPFLPTLYTHFETDRFSCLVMEYVQVAICTR